MSSIIGQGFDYLFKMVVIGDSGVGKTNLLSRFEKNEFTHQSKATIGVEFATKTVSFENVKIKTQIWDTAGQQRYRAITHAYYKGASGALVVYDVTRRSTYQNLPKWLKQLKQNSQEQMVCILIGNKSDRDADRCVKAEQAIEFAHKNQIFYLQTSALTGNNVDNAFITAIKEIYNEIKVKGKPSLKKDNNNNHILLDRQVVQQAPAQGKSCCK